MAQQQINLGTVPNDGTGDPLRTAMDKVNDNFTELYGRSPTFSGSVPPEGAVSASPGTLYVQSDGYN